MARLSLGLLGPTQVAVNGQPCVLTPRLLAILAYLAMEGTRPHRRESLAALFWPDRPYSAALGNLRSALRDLRLALGEQQSAIPLLLVTSADIQINRKGDYWLDVDAFHDLLARRADPADLSPQEQAVALYRGPLLEGLTLSGSTEWEEWVLIRREALHRRILGALTALVDSYELRQEYERGIACAQRAIELDPWQEEIYRQLMRLQALAGHRSAAIVQYLRCEQVMRRDLGMQLSSETILLYEHIRHGMTLPAREPAGHDGQRAGPAAISYAPKTGDPLPSSRAALEPHPFRLVARRREVERLSEHLLRALDGQGRVALVTGEAGSGKTALVEAFCREAMEAHPELLVAISRCSVRGGLGDAYQPFREILLMLTMGASGEPSVEAHRKRQAQAEALPIGVHGCSGALSSGHVQRLSAAAPAALAALSEAGPDLVRLVSFAPSLLRSAEAVAPSGAAWLARLNGLVAQAASSSSAFGQQAALHEQALGMLRALAQRRPLLLVLDDLQWADRPSLDLLFHLGRHLHASRILIVATFRPEEDSRRADWDLAGSAADPFPPTGSHAGLAQERHPLAQERHPLAQERHPLAQERHPLAQERHPLEALGNEFQRQWGDIRIDLAESEGREFVWAYLDTQPNSLGAPFRQALLRHTGGNPLFTVELVRAMQARGDLVRDAQGRWIEGHSLDWRQLPPRVEGSIAQRIAQLTEAQQQLLAVASVVGVDFSAELLARVLGEPQQAVIAALGALNRERLVEALGLQRVEITGAAEPLALSRYRFRHELFQTYLYGRLDAVTRAHLHGAVGSALEALYGQETDPIAGQLARHFEAAGKIGQAAGYLLRAGRQAARLGAHQQAIGSYERALALIAELPDTLDRTQREFAIQMAMEHSMLFSTGWGAPERLRTALRAYELGKKIGLATPAMLRALRSVANMSAVRGEQEQAMLLANELLTAAEHLEEPLYIASAHATLALCATMQVDLPRARAHIAPALAFCQRAPHILTMEEMQTLRPHTEFTMSFILLAEGRIDQARRQIEETLAYPHWNSPQTVAAVHSMVAIIHAVLREDRLAAQSAEAAILTLGATEATELRAWCDGVLGWAQVHAGQHREGLARLVAAIGAQPLQSTLIFRFSQSALLVEAYLTAGELDLALEAAEQAIARIAKTGFRYHEADIWRLKGEVLLQREHREGRPSAESPLACYEHALEIARRQGMRLWELRASTSLARLWAQGSHGEEARQTLAAIYATFSEGLDTPDLTEARALLSGPTAPTS